MVLGADDLADGSSKVQMTTAERTKLSGIASAATANSSDATLLARANHTGTQSADTLTDGTTNKAFTATERTKLSGVAIAATANSSDALLRDRSTHTGTQAISTVTSLQTTLDGKVAAVTSNAKLWIGTQAAYDAISSKDATTLYAITG